MQYLMLIYMDDKQFGLLPREEQNHVHRECGAWHEELIRTGKSSGAFGLQPVSTSTSLRESNGQTVISDGPFAETKEILGGLEVLECSDLNEAIEIARRFPALKVGSTVEVRPTVPGGKCGD